MNQAELTAALAVANTKIGKIREEQTALATSLTAARDALADKVAELKAIIEAGTVTEEVTNALAAVQKSLNEFDDVIPDAPAPQS